MNKFISIVDDDDEKLVINIDYITKISVLRDLINIELVDQPRPISIVYTKENWGDLMSTLLR